MHSNLQAEIIKELGILPVFSADIEVRRRIDFLKNYLRDNDMRSYILGISGGVDSTTAGKLAKLAVDELNEEAYWCRFVAVRLPYGNQVDADDAQKAIIFIRPDEVYEVNIRDATDDAIDAISQEVLWASPDMVDKEDIDLIRGNIKARQRMVVQYAIAALEKGIVIGTDHGAEAVMGFFTKFGDGAADILPLSGLNKRRVRAIAENLGAPPNLVNKVPTADLEDDRPGFPDEAAYGVTYDQIDDFLEGKEIDDRAHDIIVRAFLKTRHKRALPVTP